MLKIYSEVANLQAALAELRNNKSTIGFVPTMGALHPGHLSLVERANSENDVSVASVFVNPTQFNDQNDFSRYPRDIEKDANLLEQAGCSYLFSPAVNEVYPDNTYKQTDFNPGSIAAVLEGKFRPGHFGGMVAVVKRLLEIVMPHKAYFGLKDYQQYLIVKKLVNFYGFPIEVIGVPTMREESGLAMSSRNELLSSEERRKASIIYTCLKEAETDIGNNRKFSEIKAEKISRLESEGFKVDYFDICDANSLQPVQNWNEKQQLVVCTAVYLGKVRLIDNILPG